jgi:hypothetical protein
LYHTESLPAGRGCTDAPSSAEPAERYAAEMEALAKAGQLAALSPLLDALESEVGKLVAVLRD